MKGNSKKGSKAPRERGGRGKRWVEEEALRQSEEKFAKAFHSSPNPISITTLKEGRCLDVNDSFLRTTGYQREEIVGRTTLELGIWARPEDRDRIVRTVQTEGRVSNLEIDFRMKSAQVRTGLVSVEPIDLGGEPCLLTVISDITERKQAETKYTTVVETALDGFWIIDLKGRFLEVNNSYCQMIGYTREELLTMSISDVEAVESPEVTTQRIRKIAEQGYDRFDTRHRRKDGQIIDLEINVRYSDVDGGREVVFIRDITERKQAEEALRKAKEFAESLITSMQDGFSILDSHGVHVDVNPALCRMTGLSREELIGAGPPHPYWPPESLEEIERAFQKTLNGEFGDFELTFMQKDGERFPVIVSPSWVKDTQGNVVSYFATVKDITERRQAEEALRLSEERYRSLFEGYGDPITIYGMDGRILLINTVGARNFGGRPGDFVGKSYHELFPEQGDAFLERHRQIALSGVAAEFEDMVQLPSGKHWFWSILQPIKDENGNAYAVQMVSHDITERKRAEEALRESEAKLRLLAENVTDLIYVMDMDMKVTYLNPSITRLLGFSVEEGMARGLTESLTPASLGLAAKALQSVLRAGKVSPEDFQDYGRLELEMYRKDGSTIWAESVVTVMRDPDGRPLGILGVTRDISERKRMEEALRESEHKYAAVAEQAADGIVIVQDGVIKYANNGHAQITGYSVEELVGTPFLDTIDPSARDQVVQRYDGRMTGTPISVVLETMMLCKDGTVKEAEARSTTIEHQGRPAVLSVVRDITERKQAEEELQRKEELFRSLIENSSDAIVILNADGTVRYQSPSYIRVLGYLSEDEVGRSMFDNIHPDDMAKVSEDFARLLQDPSYTSHFEVRVRVKDGSWRTIEGTSRNLLHHPAVEGIVVNFRDVTERKRAEQELREAYERETQLRSELETEMEKRVELTRALVHELKTPLTSVIASSELLALELPEGPLFRMAKNINRSAGNLNKRIDELLDVARGELGMLRLNLMSVDPLRVLQGLAEDMGPIALSQHQSLLLDLPPSLPRVWADESRLLQVVLNLLSNACKFTGEGGKITLKAREEGDKLIVEVEDTGPGISEAEQQRLFTAYYRGEADRERFSGLGLGLALCKMLVELHGGQIWVRSQPGKGSTFGFSLPLATESQQGEVAEGDEGE
jgi:PAS domain S-box-containing protein